MADLGECRLALGHREGSPGWGCVCSSQAGGGAHRVSGWRTGLSVAQALRPPARGALSGAAAWSAQPPARAARCTPTARRAPGHVTGFSHVLSSDLHRSPALGHARPHFIKEETEAPRGHVTCPRSAGRT